MEFVRHTKPELKTVTYTYHTVPTEQSERQIERWLGKQIKSLGGLYLKLQSGSGIPDRLVIISDQSGACKRSNAKHVFFVELKRQSGRLSEVQKAYIAELTRQGQSVVVIYGKTGAEQFVTLLRGQYGSI